MSEKNKNRLMAGGLVFWQYSILMVFLLSGPWFSQHIISLLIQIIGLFLGIWAIWSMRRSRLNIAPCVRKGSNLIQDGPYRFLRHPMYLSILLFFAPLLTESPSPLRVVSFIALIPGLFIKLNFEEKRLLEHFGLHYSLYMNKTWKFIPFIY